MGRKAAKVAAKKQKGEAIRTKLYGKYGKLIVTAVKEGGGADPVANTQLAKVLADAARLSVPRDLVERNIKRATDTSQADFMELTYEAYGAGGVGIVIEVLSDNVNRAAADTKAAINKNGKVAEPGRCSSTSSARASSPSTAWRTRRRRCSRWPRRTGGDGHRSAGGRRRGVRGDHRGGGVHGVPARPRRHRLRHQPDGTALKMVPLAEVEVNDEAAETNEKLVEKLLELDDVDAVYTQ